MSIVERLPRDMGEARVDEVPDVWHARSSWMLTNGETCDCDFVCVDPEFAEVTRAALGPGDEWTVLPLGPRVLLIRVLGVAAAPGKLLGDPAA